MRRNQVFFIATITALELHARFGGSITWSRWGIAFFPDLTGFSPCGTTPRVLGDEVLVVKVGWCSQWLRGHALVWRVRPFKLRENEVDKKREEAFRSVHHGVGYSFFQFFFYLCFYLFFVFVFVFVYFVFLSSNVFQLRYTICLNSNKSVLR